MLQTDLSGNGKPESGALGILTQLGFIKLIKNIRITSKTNSYQMTMTVLITATQVLSDHSAEQSLQNYHKNTK